MASGWHTGGGYASLPHGQKQSSLLALGFPALAFGLHARCLKQADVHYGGS